ncbi:hypothetical protein B0A52_05192 [Exophiala mesophila]|uniref:Protein MGR2 n=1 Tax=Exophiala mesophila TaxID=212818 RepID=A0A438N4C6_EXOME|nr:hypothetical protein B0A52_05192 [Exophiala mesophila]
MPPMPPSAQRRGPSWVDKLKMGMLMGGTVGGIMGLIYGTVTVFQYGGGQAGVMRTLGKYMVGSGATFRYILFLAPALVSVELLLTGSGTSVFMGIGSLIRTDCPPTASSVWARSRYPPLIHPRRDRIQFR